ncbi:MAG: ABC transporter ATP-binding protein/permease [Succinivibrionaceae bacterium]|nr:ABC transporter ATP-binding protein/permease [Succinivibrionaceae bacterium]
MWQYLRPYLTPALLAILAMVGEVAMDLAQPGLLSRIIDEGILGGVDLPLIGRLGLLMLGLALLGGAMGAACNILVQYAGQGMGNRLRKACLGKIMGMSAPDLGRFGKGALITRATNDIEKAQALAMMLCRGLVRTCAMLAGSVALLLWLAPSLAMIALGSLPPAALAIWLLVRACNPLFARLQRGMDSLNALLTEDLGALRVIKSFVREAHEARRIGKASHELMRLQVRALLLMALMNPLVNAIIYSAIALILLQGAGDVAQGSGTTGAVVAALTYATMMLHSLLMLTFLMGGISRGLVSWRRIREVLSCPGAIVDGSQDLPPALARGIELRDVSFSYPGSPRPALCGVSLTIRPGERVAIMGATGCGKSTLAMLLTRCHDVCSGAILVDGVDLRKARIQSLRDLITLVPQRTEIFSGTIADNLRLGKPSASDSELWAAARVSCAAEFIERDPRGLGAPVAQRGASLSGGQRQRLALGRAALRGSGVMILDDSTSALDLRTEAAAYKALFAAFPRSTFVIVAQRVATARHAGRIVLLDQGRVAASGTHDELLSSSPLYQEICRSQQWAGGAA